MAEPNPKSNYEGSIVRVGNSRGMRLPARFFQAHPEFAGKVQLTVVADGAVLMSAIPISEPVDAEEDPVLTSFLGFLEKQMGARPEDIVAADAAQLRRIAKLVKGVATE